MNKLIIYLCLLAGCNNTYYHNANEYPELIVKKKLQKLYDNTLWNHYAMMSDFRTAELNNSVDTLCLSCNLVGYAYYKQDSLLNISFSQVPILKNGEEKYYSCHHLSVPDTYNFKKDTLIEALIGNVLVFSKNRIGESFSEPLYERQYNKSWIENFPNIIRKYKDQLNPWLKIEAQRRGIID
jgi:hypothetical protein